MNLRQTSILLWLGMIGHVGFPFSLSAQYNPCELRWLNVVRDGTANSPGVFINQAVAFDSRRQVTVFFGGQNQLAGVLHTSETWEWNGANWIKRNSGEATARREAAMAYDSDRGVCVLFGGGTNILQGHTPFNDTWEWNGSNWTLRQDNNPTASDRPPPLERPMLVYDSFRRRMILSGSSEHFDFDIRPITRTWEWDGNSWSVHSNAPPPRLNSAMAFDPIRRVTVLFGGTGYNGGSYLNDTWTWDGTIWKLAPVASAPAPRDQHAMAFDLHRKVLVLVGGASGNIEAPFNDTFEWNGVSWSYVPRADTLGLSPRQLHKMWYETAQQRVMLFGGKVSLRGSDGTYHHTIYDSVYEARPPGQWVAFNYPGQPTSGENGFFNTPFNTLAEAVNAASAGCTINLKSGSRAETISITKQLQLEAYYGPVTIGQ
jgi:hypothetical protein